MIEKIGELLKRDERDDWFFLCFALWKKLIRTAVRKSLKEGVKSK